MDTRPNILLIAVDTLRADHLGCYGYEVPTSPHIDALASEGVLGERLFCPAIPTYPSFTTLYTGQHPITHGIVAHGGHAQLDREAPFLTQLFLEAGYTTCAVDNLNRARPWFARGYEFFIDPSVRRTLLLGVTCEEINHRAIPWLRAHADEPFFLFIHYWDPHWPYNAPARYRGLFYEGSDPTDPNNHALDEWWQTPLGSIARDTWLRTEKGLITDPDHIAALYDQEIRHLDDGVEALLEALNDVGLAERTLVVFLADHGESLTEHGVFFGHHGLYDCTLHVPLIVRWPERLPRGVRLPHVIQHHDIAPTLLEAAGLPIRTAMEGCSFWRLLTGEQQEGGCERVISAECTQQAKWSLRTDDYKFILARKPDFYGNPMRELYDLRADPQEEDNLAETQPEIAAAMEAELEDWIAERLQALGKTEDPLREQGVTLGRDLIEW